MALDPLEKDRLRNKMALKMGIFMESGGSVTCVSAHAYDEQHLCELCNDTHAQEILVIKNRPGKKMLVGLGCLKEMVRFKVVDVEELPRWIGKLGELKTENEKRKIETQKAREEERKRLEKKVVVRKRDPLKSANGPTSAN